MRLLLVSEGKHELGDGTAPGALETLVRRLRDGNDLVFERRRVSDPTLHAHHGKGQGYLKRTIRWLLRAADEGYDGLVLVVDHDGFDARIREMDEAQQDVHSNLPRALGVAVRSFDAWMLSDEGALRQVLGMVVDRQPNPEDIRVPKARCAELRDASPNAVDLAEMYASVASVCDLTLIAERCPRGFRPFALRCQSLPGGAESSVN